jgi:hypothetical protein
MRVSFAGFSVPPNPVYANSQPTLSVKAPKIKDSNSSVVIRGFEDNFIASQTPKFQGRKATQLLNEGLLLKASQMRTVMSLDDDPYYGTVPAALLEAIGCTETQFRSGLEELVLTLKKDKPEQLTYPLSKDKALQVNLAGEGTDARVYKISIDDKSYALKVFFEPGAGSALQETANGAFFNAHNTRDVSRLYFSNPSKRWTLMEFIGKDSRISTRSGLTMKQQQFGTDDEVHGPNKINHILVDHGGTLTIPESLAIKATLFNQRLIELGLVLPETAEQATQTETFPAVLKTATLEA